MNHKSSIRPQLERALAEVELARRRAQVDLRAVHDYAIADFVRDVLPIKDALEAAQNVRTDDARALRSGLAIALRQLHAAVARHTHIDAGG